MTYLLEHVKIRFDIKKLARNEYPEDALREAIVNSVVHRDYFINSEGAIEKLRGKIIINNLGGLMFNKAKFGTTSFPRNKLIADLLSKTFYMEKVGTGIKRIERDCKQNNNHIEFDFTDDFFFTIFTSNSTDIKLKTAQETVQEIKKISTKNLIILNIQKKSNITRDELAIIIGVSSSAIKKHLANLKIEGVIERVGSTKAGHWEIVDV